MVTEKMIEAALSTDAEPVAIYKGNGLIDCGDGGHHNIELLKIISANTSLYAAPPAPSVAVKELEWVYTERTVGTYIARDERGDMYWINQLFGSDSYYFTTIRRVDGKTLYDADDLDTAKAAAQADYEARIRSALSAQVQDVAIPQGWQLVPKEPTEEMELRGCRASEKTPDEVRPSTAKAIYIAMLAAAPAAKQGEAE